MAFETAIVGGLIGMLFLWAYISFNLGGGNLKEEQNTAPLRLLLLLLVFTGMGLALFVMHIIAEQNLASLANLLESAYKTYIWVFTFITGYLIINYGIFMVRKMTEKKPTA